jgi:ribosomal protein L27
MNPFGILPLMTSRSFATKMMAGSTSNKKDSAGRRLGVKRFGAAEMLENEIVAR